jgi:TonB family protein
VIEASTAVIVARSREHDGLLSVVGLSIVVHMAALGVVAVMPSAVAVSDTPKTVMTISLGGAPGPRAGGMTPMGGRAVQQVTPPEAAPRIESPAASTAPVMTLPSKSVRVRPPIAPPKSPTSTAGGRTATTGEEVRDGRARSDTGARGQGFGLTGGGGGGAGAYLDVGDFCCPDYLELIVQAIQRNWTSKQGATGQTLMKFTIGKDGELSDVLVERPSGFAALDSAAQRALLVTERVPPLPSAFPNPDLTVHLRFEYQR